MGKALSDSLVIRDLHIKNRICAGPMGPTTKSEDGLVTPEIVEHFRRIAANQAGLILQGAMSTSSTCLARSTQMSLGSDKVIKGLSELTEAVHQEDGKIIVQLEHPGIRTMETNPPAPSEFLLKGRDGEKECRALSVEEIEAIEQEYVEAALRTVQAGYDGIEIHVSHGWLPDNFLNPCINGRTDKYGQDRTLFIREIFQRIREVVPENYVIGIRMAAFNPHLQDGIFNAKAFETMGFDYIDISNNPSVAFMPQMMCKPEGWQLSEHEYSAKVIKEEVKIPVFGGKNLRSTEDATLALSIADLDMVVIARGFLCDPLWAVKALELKEQNLCRHCKRCTWSLGGNTCAALASK